MPKSKSKSPSSNQKHSINSNIQNAPSGQTFSLRDKSSKKNIDILQGLILHKDVIPPTLEQDLITFIQSQCSKGRSGQLKKPTYLRSSGARSRGNQREALQYGGFFDFNRARPGKRGLVPDFPPIIEQLVNHLINNGYLEESVRPDSCIINQYGKGDCIPPHIDHESYHRPISTLSLLGEEPMLVGTKFQTVKSCTWKPVVGTSVMLPRRSLLLLGGNAGNVSKHCISSCRGERISITLRKQPGLDWRPSVEELSRSGGKKRKRDGVVGADNTTSSGGSNGERNDGSVDGTKKKKKALSGSAKRRKKMMKLKGIVPSDSTNNNDGIVQQQQQQKQQQVNQSQSGKTKTSAKKRNSEQQAKRNARRLEKKRRSISAGDVNSDM